MKFEELNIDIRFKEILKEKSFETTTGIQEKAIPEILDRKDVIGISGTGSGKSLAFILPSLQIVEENKSDKGIKAIVLLPTRELAVQLGEVCRELCTGNNIKTTLIYGGSDINLQIEELKNGTDIILATPGRLADLIRRGEVNKENVKILVLDECDRMLDMGFKEDIDFIIKDLPVHTQKIMFSATVSEEINKMINGVMKDPVRIEVAGEIKVPENIEQKLYYVERQNKNMLLMEFLRKQNFGSTVIFTKTRKSADALYEFLQKNGIDSSDRLHSDRSQTARETILQNFRKGELSVLIATDIAARGIDVEHISHVINYELPQETETFIHRIGRTGRAGRAGSAITLAEPDDKEKLAAIQKMMKRHIPVVENHTYATVSLKKAIIAADEKIAGKAPKKQYMGSKANGDFFRRQKMAQRKNKK